MSGSVKQFKSDYSRVDKVLHHLAFRFPAMQRILAEMENDLFRKKISLVKGGNEVFVTGLPRSGTTLLLNLLFNTDEFSTFTYRQMPFLMTPLLWHKVSAPFQVKGTSRERAHGDKVSVSFDSPEAFEEAIWLAYMRGKIEAENHLMPIAADGYTSELEQGLKASIAKLVALSTEIGGVANRRNVRYLSKNNANLSRLSALSRMFPKSVILVPFREPAAHVGSLMKQHSQFLLQHQDDSFSRQYMRWIGHFEFGKNLKPANFENWLVDRKIEPETVDENFWLEYWIHAYRYVLNCPSSNIYLVDYDALISQGEQTLARLADLIQLGHRDSFIDAAKSFRRPTSLPVDSSRFSPRLWQEALVVREKLISIAF